MKNKWVADYIQDKLGISRHCLYLSRIFHVFLIISLHVNITPVLSKAIYGHNGRYPVRPMFGSLRENALKNIGLIGSYDSTFYQQELKNEQYQNEDIASQIELGIRFFEVPAFFLDNVWYTASDESQIKLIKNKYGATPNDIPLSLQESVVDPLLEAIRSENQIEFFVLSFSSIRCKASSKEHRFTVEHICIGSLAQLLEKRLGPYMLKMEKPGELLLDKKTLALQDVDNNWEKFNEGMRLLGKEVFSIPLDMLMIGTKKARIFVLVPYLETSVNWMAITGLVFFPVQSILRVYKSTNKARATCINKEKKTDNHIELKDKVSSYEYCLELCNSKKDCAKISYSDKDHTCALSAESAKLLEAPDSVAIEINCWNENGKNSVHATSEDIKKSIKEELCNNDVKNCMPLRNTTNAKHVLTSVHFFSTNAAVNMNKELTSFCGWLNTWSNSEPAGLINFLVITHVGTWGQLKGQGIVEGMTLLNPKYDLKWQPFEQHSLEETKTERKVITPKVTDIRPTLVKSNDIRITKARNAPSLWQRFIRVAIGFVIVISALLLYQCEVVSKIRGIIQQTGGTGSFAVPSRHTYGPHISLSERIPQKYFVPLHNEDDAADFYRKAPVYIPNSSRKPDYRPATSTNLPLSTSTFEPNSDGTSEEDVANEHEKTEQPQNILLI